MEKVGEETAKGGVGLPVNRWGIEGDFYRVAVKSRERTFPRPRLYVNSQSETFRGFR